MRSKQPDRVTPHNPPRRLYQDIPDAAAKIQAKLAALPKKTEAEATETEAAKPTKAAAKPKADKKKT